MIANMKAFGDVGEYIAYVELKNNLKALKTETEIVLHSMDLLIGRIRFEGDEAEKWTALRDALLDFRTLEVSPNIVYKV